MPKFSRFLYFVYFSISLISSTNIAIGATKSNPISIGTVLETKGAPDVLRNPIKKLTKDLKENAKKKGYSVALHKKLYWESYKIRKGSALYYGDMLSSGIKSKLYLTLKNGFKIILEKNTYLKLTPFYVQKKKKEKQEGWPTWVYLVSGKIRSFLKTKNKEAHEATRFRTKSLTLGVRGTDFVLGHQHKQSELITLDGKVAVNSVSNEEAKKFEQFADKVSLEPAKKADEIFSNLHQINTEEETILSKGEMIKKREQPSQKNIEKLSENMSKEELNKEMKNYNLSKVTKVTPKDLKPYKNIAASFQPKELSQNDGMKELLKEEKKSKEKPSTPFGNTLAFYFALGSNDYKTHVHGEQEVTMATDGGMEIGIEGRYNSYLTLGGHFFIGDWNDAKGAESIGFRKAEARNSIVQTGIDLMANKNWGNFRIGLKVSYLQEVNTIIRYYQFGRDDSFHLTATYLFSPMIRTTINLAYQILPNWSVLFQGGGGSSDVEITNIVYSSEAGSSDLNGKKGKYELGSARFGILFQY